MHSVRSRRALAVLHWLPTAVVGVAAIVLHETSALAIGAAWLVAVLASLADEFVVVRPVARRHAVEL